MAHGRLSSTFVLKVANQLASQYGKASWIKIKYSDLGTKGNFATLLNQGVGSLFTTSLKDIGSVRIDLACHNFTKKGTSDVPENIIYSASRGGSRYITDNIVPHAWEMNFEAYIPYDVSIGGAFSYLLDELIGGVTSSATTVSLRKRITRNILERAFEYGIPVAFKDDNQQTYNECAIKSIEFLPTGETENHIRARVTLKEMRTVQVNSGTLSDIFDKMNFANVGSIFGNNLDVGNSAIEWVAEGLSTVGSTVTNLMSWF